MKRGLPALFWALGLLLLGSMGLTILGRSGDPGVPTQRSAYPGGTQAYFELLEREGYKVRRERTQHPRLDDADLIVVPVTAEASVLASQENSAEAMLRKKVVSRVLAGTPVLQLGFSGVGAELLEPTEVRFTRDPEAKPLTVDRNWNQSFEPLIAMPDGTPMTLVNDGDTVPFVRAHTQGDGMLVNVIGADFLTNASIDQNDNAELGLRLVRAFVPPGSTIVLTEVGIGAYETQSMLGALGPWAQILLAQAIVVFLVVVYTNNVRFGLPANPRLKRRSSRELIDAFSLTMMRGRRTDVALALLAGTIESRLRRLYQIDREQPIGKDTRIPGSLRSFLLTARDQEGPRLKESDAIRQAREALAELEQIEAELRGRTSRR